MEQHNYIRTRHVVEIIAEETCQPKRVVLEVIENFFVVVQESLEKNEEVSIPNFGKFYVRKTSFTPRFKAAPEFKELVKHIGQE